MIRFVLATFLAASTTVAAAGDIARMPGESSASFACRKLLVPSARSCVARCEARHQGALDGEARWSCVQACTEDHLAAMADCRAELSTAKPADTGRLATR
ncbi:MAG TPA: hypothetical protein VML50_17485 [Anaeromyxobacter sp.]|nr:hypothetical protein [Anaeromyxobacter sp.]